MDPDKVDSISKWKVPTNQDQLQGFLGSVGYLSDDVPNIRISMGVLSAITGDTVSFRWGFTEQRAFEDMKALVHLARTLSRVPISYAKEAQQVWVITDGCNSGILGVTSQGSDWKMAKVAAFYSAKLNSAQQNYPVHKVEMLAGVETMLRHRDVLLGVYFKWLTDHKGLVHLLNQKNLSGRQARWLERISIFDYAIEYVAGSENVLADALSHIYAADSAEVIRSWSEYTYFDVVDSDSDSVAVTCPTIAAVSTRHMDVLPAETGCPETSREFAARIRGRFRLQGPRLRREGENGNTIAVPPSTEPLTEPVTECPLLDLVSEGVNLLNEFWGNYS
jgi:hypothetical protein